MNHNVQINCPNCNTSINVEDVLGAKVEERLRQEFNEKMTLQNNRLLLEKQELEKAQLDFAEKKRNENELCQKKLNEEREKLSKELAEKALAEVDLKVQALHKELEESKTKATQLQKTEIELLQLQKKIKEREEAFELEKQKALLEYQARIVEEEARKAAEKYELKDKEWATKFEQQKKLIEEMKRKSEQGSMQLQGEALELLLEDLLKTAFPYDHIQEVAKGVKGADIMQSVMNSMQQECGKIIYESKRTKEFSNEWIDKLKQDMRAQSADIAVLVTQTMPKGMEQFGLRDGVWICNFQEVQALATVLRDSIIKIHQAMISQENKGDKMHMLYHYLTGNEFSQQMLAIVEGFTSMQDSINSERRAMEKIWKEREKQIEKVLLNTTHMYGSIRGIAGNAIGTIQQLELGE